ncbi:hypothetical protein WIW50_19485 [Flavobacteriaceae bacterium 3-367]
MNVVDNFDNPTALVKMFPKTYNRLASAHLGFGYRIISRSTPGGYISINCDFLYKKDSLVGYRLRPELPDKPKLRNKYLNWYAGKFEITENHKVKPYYHNRKSFEAPLDNYSGDKSTKVKVRAYMSPTSGLWYGGRGGWSMSLLPNRKHFLALEQSLTREIVMELMYSKNPATRLTAIEYYYKYPELFEESKEELDEWIEIIFKQVPRISTLRGCLGGQESARKLVEEYVKLSVN